MLDNIKTISDIKANLKEIRFTSIRSRVRTPEVERNEKIVEIANKIHAIATYTQNDIDLGFSEVQPATLAVIAGLESEIKVLAAAAGIEA